MFEVKLKSQKVLFVLISRYYLEEYSLFEIAAELLNIEEDHILKIKKIDQ